MKNKPLHVFVLKVSMKQEAECILLPHLYITATVHYMPTAMH